MRSLQKAYYSCHILLIVLALLTSGCAGKHPPRVPSVQHRPETVRPSRLPKLEEQVIRIGLKTDLKSTVLSSSEALYFDDGNRSGGVRSSVTAAVSFAPEIQAHYSVQVGSFSSRQQAEQAQSGLKSKTHQPTFIFENPDLHRFQVRLGPYSSKEKAQQSIEELKTNGYPDAFYVADTASAEEIPDLILRDELGNVLLKTHQVVQIWTDNLMVEIDQVRYRGYATVFVNPTGRLTVVNVVSFEGYLKGVVPNEIGPAANNAYEALKAQAVAARTYAYKNLKQFDSEGYDLCASPRCQVYSGINSENDLTSRAVTETHGEIITYQGEPINALYTSTCGGRTENAEYVFEGWNYPYLKSVECYPEESETYQRAVQIDGERAPWWLAWLSAKNGTNSAGDPTQVISVEEATTGFHRVLGSLGKTACASGEPEGTDWIAIGSYLVDQLCWQSRRDSLLNEKDYQYFLSHLDFSLNPLPETHSFLLLFHDGILMPQDLYRFNPYQPMTRADFLRALFNILDHYHQVNSKEGQVREISEQQMQIVDDLGVHMYTYANPVFLYQKVGELLSPRDQLACSSGDSVQYYLQDNQIKILVCELNQGGVAADRASKYSFWKETATPEDLAQRVSKYLDVGDIVDLQPLSYGISKRVYEIKVIGTKNSGVLKGIRVRWALGLRDTLFVIDRVFDQNGRVQQFVFTGRGWGHGLGMCQIGALGYAKQGKDYRAILTHYYTGVQITKMK